MNLDLNPKYQKEQVVMYEELAEHYYRATSQTTDYVLTVDNQVSYHVDNLILLSLYFDYIYITTASLFHCRNGFVNQVILETISHPYIKSMMEYGVIKISGWGGKISQSMYHSAEGYAQEQVIVRKSKNDLNLLKQVFDNGFVVSRDQEMPDLDLPTKFITDINNTPIANDQSSLKIIRKCIDSEWKQTNSITSINFLDQLKKTKLEKAVYHKAENILFRTALNHSKTQISDVHIYLPLMTSFDFKMKSSQESDAPFAFLVSPKIFSAFIQAEYDKNLFWMIRTNKYEKLHKLRQEEWKNFKDTYHTVLKEISKSIYLNIHQNSIDEDISYWSDKIISSINLAKGVDSTSFIEAIFTMIGILTSYPLFKPLGKIITAIFKQPISQASIHKQSSSKFGKLLEKEFLR